MKITNVILYSSLPLKYEAVIFLWDVYKTSCIPFLYQKFVFVESKETTNEKEGDGQEGDDDCGDQDVSHMELAWEMLELTCSICSR